MLNPFLIWTARVTAVLLVTAALIPLLPLGSWIVRTYDFPRGQFTILLLVPLVATLVHLVRTDYRFEHLLLLLAITVTGVWHLAHIAPYTPVWKKELADADGQGDSLRVLVANLKVENTEYDAVREALREQDADLLLLIEIDERWEEALKPLEETYPHRMGVVRGEGLGLELWSRLPLEDEEVRYLVSEQRPSLFATVVFPDGHSTRFVGVHPTPPGLDDSTDGGRRDSRVRDAELVLVAREVARHDDLPWVVAGDFNDVAWSPTTRLFKRLSGLRDPRVGRSLLSSYHAEYPILRFPIDQMYYSAGFQIHCLDRIRLPGSDHFGVYADVNLAHREGVDPDADPEERERSRELVEEGMEDAQERNVHAGS